MPLRKILAILCPAISAISMAYGFALPGIWFGVITSFFIFGGWLFLLRRPSNGLSVAVLVISVCLSALGLLIGASPLLMVIAATLALASWDFVLFNASLPGEQPGKSVALLEKVHLESLALAVGLGLIVSIAGHFIRFQIPFIVMVLLVILGLFSLERVWRKLQ
jgi:hypothetical protein